MQRLGHALAHCPRISVALRAWLRHRLLFHVNIGNLCQWEACKWSQLHGGNASPQSRVNECHEHRESCMAIFGH